MHVCQATAWKVSTAESRDAWRSLRGSRAAAAVDQPDGLAHLTWLAAVPPPPGRISER